MPQRWGFVVVSTVLLCSFEFAYCQKSAADRSGSDVKEESPAVLGAMRGSPPPAEQQVTWENWESSHEKQRWAMQHLRELFPTQSVTGGDAPVITLEQAPRDVMQVCFERHDGQKTTIAEALDRLEVDAFVVMHNGKLVSENYFHGMRRDTPHFLLSIHKSIVSTVIATLIEDQLLSMNTAIDTYVPELKETAHSGATVRQSLDMLSAVEYTYRPVGSRQATFAAHKKSVHPAAPYLDVPVGSQEFVLTLPRLGGAHGESMHYKESDPAILIWAAERVTGKRFAALVEQRLWSKIGAEFELEAVCDPRGCWTHYVSATARDLARWGQMILENGHCNGQSVVPITFITDVRENASVDLLQAEPFVGAYLPDGIGYRSFFYVDNHGDKAIVALGGYGQLCYISPEHDTVIVIFSSPVPNEAEMANGKDPEAVWHKTRGEELDRWNLCRTLCIWLSNRTLGQQ